MVLSRLVYRKGADLLALAMVELCARYGMKQGNASGVAHHHLSRVAADRWFTCVTGPIGTAACN